MSATYEIYRHEFVTAVNPTQKAAETIARLLNDDDNSWDDWIEVYPVINGSVPFSCAGSYGVHVLPTLQRLDVYLDGYLIRHASQYHVSLGDGDDPAVAVAKRESLIDYQKLCQCLADNDHE